MQNLLQFKKNFLSLHQEKEQNIKILTNNKKLLRL